jgi:(p)ppGpp synthase/HD superfamily hydrolase
MSKAGTTDLPRFSQALAYAEELHRDQKRKASEVPYISHLLAVCALVIENGGDEDQAIAALLHDAVEDQGGEGTLSVILARFGERVARIVLACSDTAVVPKPEWRPRKETYIARMESEGEDVLLVSLADKVHNARSILLDHQAIGDEVWTRFNGKQEGTLWYYRALCEAFRGRTPAGLHGQLEAAVVRLEAA